jgi:hypothetical protein
MAAKMTSVSSQPWMKALKMLATKMVMKKMNMPIFSPMPSCSLFRSLQKVMDHVKHAMDFEFD